MSIAKHILEIKNTLANLIGGKMVDGQMAIATDLNGAPITQVGTSRNIPAMSKKTTDGVTFTYLDTEFNDVDAKGLVKSESGLYKGSVLTTNIDMSLSDQVNHNIEGVSVIELKSDSAAINVPLSVIGDITTPGDITGAGGSITSASGIVSNTNVTGSGIIANENVTINGDTGVSSYESCPDGYTSQKLRTMPDISGEYSSASNDDPQKWHTDDAEVYDYDLDGTHATPWTNPYPTGFAPIREISASAMVNFFLSGNYTASKAKLARMLFMHKAETNATAANAMGVVPQILFEIIKQTGSSDYAFTEALKLVLTNKDGDDSVDLRTNPVAVAVHNHTYGDLHCHDASTAQSIANGTTYVKMTCFTATEAYHDCKPDVANDEIIIKRAGTYRICFTVSYTSGTNNVTFKFAAFKDTTEIDNIHAQTKIATGADSQNVSCCGFKTLAAGEKVSLRVRHDAGGAVNLTPIYASLCVERKGE